MPAKEKFEPKHNAKSELNKPKGGKAKDEERAKKAAKDKDKEGRFK